MTVISPHTTRAPGTILTAAIYNLDHGNHIANAQALNAGKVEGAGPVADGAVALFDGVSGSALRSGGGAPVITPVDTADISNDAVTYAKIQDVSASPRVLGLDGAAPGDVEELTLQRVTTLGRTFISDITAGFTMDEDERSSQVVIASGSGNLNLPPASTTTAQYFAIITNQGTGSATIVADGSDNINGLASYVIPAGAIYLLQMAGSPNWRITELENPANHFGRLLASGVVSNAATLDLVLTAYTGFRGLIFKLSNFIPASDAILNMRVSTNGGSSYDSGASDYAWVAQRVRAGTTAETNSSDTADDSMQISGGDNVESTGPGITCEVTIMNQAASLETLVHTSGVMVLNTPDLAIFHSAGRRLASQNTDAVRFFFTGANIASGNYAVYGLS